MDILVRSEDTYGSTYLLKRLNGVYNSRGALLVDVIRGYKGITGFPIGDDILWIQDSLGSAVIGLDSMGIECIKENNIAKIIYVYDTDAPRGRAGLVTVLDMQKGVKKIHESLRGDYIERPVDILFAPIVHCAETLILNCLYGGNETDFAEVMHRVNTAKLHRLMLVPHLLALSNQSGNKRTGVSERELKRTDTILFGEELCIDEETCVKREHEKVLLWLGSVFNKSQYLYNESAMLEFHDFVTTWYESLESRHSTNSVYTHYGVDFNLFREESIHDIISKINGE